MRRLAPGFAALLSTTLAIPAVLAGGDADPPETVHFQQTLSARAGWDLNRRHNYRFTLHRDCYCASPNDVEIEVRNGEIVRVTDLAKGTELDDATRADYPTIARLFTEIDEAVARNPDSMHVEYDRHLGFPARVDIDISYRMADEELRFTIDNVELF